MARIVFAGWFDRWPSLNALQGIAVDGGLIEVVGRRSTRRYQGVRAS
jgi:hypothetical protein